jgi:hypothetical protein
MFNNAFLIDLNLAEDRVGTPPAGADEYTASGI